LSNSSRRRAPGTIERLLVTAFLAGSKDHSGRLFFYRSDQTDLSDPTDLFFLYIPENFQQSSYSMTQECRCSEGSCGGTRYEEIVLDTLLYSARLKESVARRDSDTIVAMATQITDTFRDGGKVLLCGNGGSAADAQHLAAELTIRYRSSVQRPALPAIALSTDTSALTAGGNDLGFDEVFARLVEAYGKKEDVLIGLSTSGNSVNVLKAFQAARLRGMKTVALLGGDGGAIRPYADLSVVVPHSGSADRVQECHIAVGHVIVELVEKMMGYDQ
jgi:D-sedoheptulose 7-phosphate isomerase